MEITDYKTEKVTFLPIDQIIKGDCIDILKTLPEKSIDVIFADPPYNLQLNQELYRPNMTLVNGVNDEWDKFASSEDYTAFSRLWLSECKRVLKNTGTIWVIGSYHNIYRVGSIMQDLGFWFLNDIIWVKTNPMPNFRGVRFTNAHETLIWAQPYQGKKYTFNHHTMKTINDDLQMRSDWQIPICGGNERLRINGQKVHSTQKPEALLMRVILSSTNFGDVILDPFFGTGTTGAVAKRYGRHWIGIERDETYIKAAEARINSIQPYAFEVSEYVEKRQIEERVPFSTLIDHGLIQAGQVLFFGDSDKICAIVHKTGNIEYNGHIGSIHKVGSIIKKSPCNGWINWYYLDSESGARLPIDTLRQKLRSLHSTPPKDIE